jgi:transcriptional regulator with XRE-family HTH domain
MPRKPTQKHPIRDLRAIINKSQKAFAEIIGINPGTLKRIENNDLKLSRKIATRIFAETGADIDSLLRGELRPAYRAKLEREYSENFYRRWKEQHFRADEETAKEGTDSFAWWAGVLLRASVRKRRFWQVLQTLKETLNECRGDFGLAAHIDAILRDFEPRVRWDPFSHTPAELFLIETERVHAEKQHEKLMKRVKVHWGESTPRKGNIRVKPRPSRKRRR